MEDEKKIIAVDEDLRWRGCELIAEAKCMEDYLNFAMRAHDLSLETLSIDAAIVNDPKQRSMITLGKRITKIADKMQEIGKYMVDIYDGR